MFDRILVPTDGSAAATAAVRSALVLADRFDADIHAIHVVEGGDLPADDAPTPHDELRAHGQETLETVDELAAEVGLSPTTSLIESAPSVHEAILDTAADEHADLIVMGTHGRTGLDRLVLGSVTERTLRVSTLPVLTVHEDTGLDRDIETVLVPTDGSEVATVAAERGIEFAAATNAALHVIHVIDPGAIPAGDDGAVLSGLEAGGQEAVDAIVEQASAAGLPSVQASVLTGSPARMIFDYADERDIDLIVMGTHGRTGLDRYLLGSVTEKLVRIAETPVLTATADATDGEDGDEP